MELGCPHGKGEQNQKARLSNYEKLLENKSKDKRRKN